MFKDRSINGPMLCSLESSNFQTLTAFQLIGLDTLVPPTCPIGFRCYNSQSTKRSQCCGFNGGYCPQSSAALIVTKAGYKPRPVACGPLSGCPNNYFCNKHTHVCCTTEPINGHCEHGQPLNQPDGRAKRCSNSNCPTGYACNGQFNQSYCCPTSTLICSQTVDEGLFCLSAQPKRYFHYHQATGECRQFTYSVSSSKNLNYFTNFLRAAQTTH